MKAEQRCSACIGWFPFFLALDYRQYSALFSIASNCGFLTARTCCPRDMMLWQKVAVRGADPAFDGLLRSSQSCQALFTDFFQVCNFLQITLIKLWSSKGRGRFLIASWVSLWVWVCRFSCLGPSFWYVWPCRWISSVLTGSWIANSISTCRIYRAIDLRHTFFTRFLVMLYYFLLTWSQQKAYVLPWQRLMLLSVALYLFRLHGQLLKSPGDVRF